MNALAEQLPQRRQVTVLFCDLVGSTALSHQLDPEDLREVITAYRNTCAPIIARYDGFVQQYVGDGISVLFGYPVAHEDDAGRAAYAGLGIVNAMPGLSASLRSLGVEELQVRIGIATGLVVAGDRQGTGSAQVETIIGETPNLAARLQNIAEPNSVIIGANTHQLLGTSFEYVDLGVHEVKGFDEAVAAYRVLRPSRARTRFEASRLTNVAPLVNRLQEHRTLVELWRKSSAGHGQAVYISGEPGIGKSRLTLAMRDYLKDEDHLRLRYQCSAYYTNSPLYPVIDQMVRAAGFLREDNTRQKCDKLIHMLALSSDEPEAMLSVFAQLLSLPLVPGAQGGTGPMGETATVSRVDQPRAELTMSPERLRELTFDALVLQMRGLARRKPVLLVFEDVHWIDPTSAEVLATAIKAIENLPVMVLVTSRPGFEPAWLSESHVTELKLERLEQRDGSELVVSIARKRPLPPELVAQIVRQTDGVPLFVEELTKTLMDSEALERSGSADGAQGPLPTTAIPVTLKDSLMARLDRLGPGREIAQIAAVIGREFSHELLAAVAEREAGVGEDELADALARLIDGGLVWVIGDQRTGLYGFRHALVKDTAHESLLRRRRQSLHAAVVEVLETRFRETVNTSPELLALHCTEANLTEAAVGYWLRAGQRAAENSANTEAVAHLRKGLEMVAQIDNDAQAKQLELELLIALGPALIATEGPGALAVERNYTRTLALCKELPRSPSHFTAHWGWWFTSMNHRVGRDRATTLLELAVDLDDSGCLLQAHHCQWATLFHLGDFRNSREHVMAGLALYDHRQHRHDATQYGDHDARVCGEGEHALTSWMLGESHAATRRLRRCLRWADSLRHVGSVAHARFYEAMLHVYLNDAETVARLAPEMIRFADEQGMPSYRADGLFFLGWARCELAIRASVAGAANDNKDDLRAAIKTMSEGVDQLLDIGTKEELPTLYDLLARAYARDDRLNEAIALVDTGFEVSEQAGLGFWLAELHRCRADLLFQQKAHEADIEADLDAALATAASQGALWFELRAATSLARLRQRQGRSSEGRDVLTRAIDAVERVSAPGAHDLNQALAVLAKL